MRTRKFFTTLHGRLLKWLVIPLIVLSFAHMYSIKNNTRITSTELFDRVLINLALSISQYSISSEGDLFTVDLLDLIRKTTKDKLYYKVLGPSGSFLVGYHNLPEPPDGIKKIDNHIEIYNATYLGEPVRIVAISTLSKHSRYSGWSKTFVGQTLKDREQFTNNVIWDNLTRIVLLITVISILTFISLNFALKPLKQLIFDIKNRDIHDLTPIVNLGLPEEIASLVRGINELFIRLSKQISLSRRFLENASHQLLTPIAALTLQCDLALRKQQSPESISSLNRIKANADRISRLANQLLHLSYAEASAFDYKKETPVNLAEIVKVCVADLTELSKVTEIECKLSNTMIKANNTLITEVINNLIENSIKYGGKDNHILIETFVENDEAILQVSDQGPGIPPELRQLVTERFFRGTNDESGSGLGLAIVKEVMLVHHGSIEIDSVENGKGTKIRCSFPAYSPS